MRKHAIWIGWLLFGWVVIQSGVAAAQENPLPLMKSQEDEIVDGDHIEWAEIPILNLGTTVKIAMMGNPGLEAAIARVRQAQAQVDQARSTYWPRLDASASGARVELSQNAYEQNLAAARIVDPNIALKNPDEYYLADLTASWILFNGFERKFTNVAAKYGEQSRAAALNDTRRLLISSVALAYYSAQLASKNVAIAEANEAFNQRQLKDAKARQRVGTGPLADVLNFQIRMNDAKTERINQEYRYQIALYGLAALMGLPESRFPDHVKLAELGPETDAELANPSVQELVKLAMDFRPDIQEAKWRIKQSEALIKVAQSEYYPSIVVSGSLNGERTGDPPDGIDHYANSIRLGLTYNLFEGGRTRARVRENRQRVVELEKLLENLILSATADIRSSAALVVTAQSQVALQGENMKLAERNRGLIEKEYNAGQVSLVRLNEAQRDVIAAQSNLALARVALRQAWVELETRTGNILANYNMTATN